MNKLKNLSDQALMRNSFDYATLKNPSKWFMVKYVSPDCDCAWMLRVGKYDCSIIFSSINMLVITPATSNMSRTTIKEISIKVIGSHYVKIVSKRK